MLFKKQQTERKIDLQDTKEFWNRDYVVYDDTARISEDYNVSKDGMVDEVHLWCQKYNVPISATILEIGCGGGRILMIWNECSRRYDWNFKLEGIDHSPKAITVAKQRLPGVRFNMLEMENISGEYDIIFTHTALQHNSNWKQDLIYPKIHKALKENGLFWLINEKTFSTWEDGKLKNPFYCDDRGSAGTVAWWIQRIANVGFELLEYYRSNYTFRKI